ncbi:type I-E CRISPR-associated protein Cas6/Cse3/CasE (plasmid) [Streptomyces sp. NBC_00445]|uniref:type I-E CRISPR-associated protein Cas6/Cse3/CasE n=1 Tax=Streptomyces sp. NBC_00445 TaxID=2975745 RepID=UPI002E1B272B
MTTPTPLLPETRPALAAWRSGLTLSHKTQHDALNVHRLHGLVLAGIPALPGADRPAHVLFAAARTPQRRSRAASPDAGLPQRLLVQSPERPHWQPLLDSGQLTDAATSLAQQSYTDGDRIAVRIIANPTYRDLATRQRTALADAADCAAWLHRRLTDGGMQLVRHHVTVGAPVLITGRKGPHRITVVSRELHAHGTVRDAHRLHKLLAEGLGPAKPYGCGLLLARPLS